MSIRRFNQIFRVTTVVAVAAALAAPTVQAHIVRGTATGPGRQTVAPVPSTNLRDDAINRLLAGTVRDHPYSVAPGRNHPYSVTTRAPQAQSGGGTDWSLAGIVGGSAILIVIVAADIDVRRRGPLTT